MRRIRRAVVVADTVSILTDAVVVGLVLLLLKQAMDLEPVRAAAVARSAFRHADQEAFS